MKVLHEDSNLYKGIFWITDLDYIDNNKLYFQIPVNSDGVIDSNVDRMRLNSKNNTNYNHLNTWDELPSNMTKNKKFNYYPRGRVEIANGKATVYLNPNIATEEVKNWIIDKFNLTKHNGINSVRLVPDYSDHYKCYLD